MSVRALAQALLALAPAGVSVHVGETPPSPTLPWAVLNFAAPGVSERSLTTAPLAGPARLLVTIAGANEDAVLIILEKVLAAYEGARLVVEGWQCSPVGQVGDVKIFPDDVVIASVNRRVVVGKLTLETTVARTA
ncbi:hypothetical protein ACFWFR_00865 [Oerskovia sp. NPDC060287]|uniref:hypothetical protein n=1 Tax=Oerskovia sp. NPDC060287 TaxID=3347095 RepID=UPI003656CDB5